MNLKQQVSSIGVAVVLVAGMAAAPLPVSAAPTTHGYQVGDVVSGSGVSVVVPKRGRAATGIAEGDGTVPEVLTVATLPSGEVVVEHAIEATAPAALTAASDECTDDRYTHTESYHAWSDSPSFGFRAQSVPAELTAAQAESAMVRALGTITTGRNVCGFADAIGVEAGYAGRTGKGASMWTGANNLVCDTSRADQQNVVAFGDRAGNLAGACLAVDLAMTQLVEADILLDRANKEWYVPGQSPCQGTRRSVEAVVTHELGHAFGLGHVLGSEELTMSDNGIPVCQNTEATLGLGDLLGLEARY